MSEELGEGRLSAEDADRLAADIRPAWDLDDGSLEEGAMGAAEEALLAGEAPISGAPTDPSPPPPAHDTLIQGTPTLTLGGVAGDAPAVETGGPVSTSRTQQVPEPARKKTIMGLGNDPASSQPIPLARKLAPPSGAPEKGPGDTLESPKLDLPRTSKPGSSGKANPVSTRVASSRPSEESIDLPITKSSSSTLWIGLGLAAVAAVVLGVVLLGGDDPKPPTAATTTATPTTPAPTATAAPTALPAVTATAAPTTPPAPATAAPTATPAATTPTAAPPTPAKPPPAGKPTGGTPPAKPTSTGKPGLMRDAPF